MLESSKQIVRKQKVTLEQALILLSWIPIALTAVLLPTVFIRAEWNEVSVALAIIGITLSLTRLYFWLKGKPISNRYLAGTVVIMLGVAGIGYYGYGPTSGAVEVGLVGLVAGYVIATEKRYRLILSLGACALFLVIGIHNLDKLITTAAISDWYSLTAGDQRFVVLASSLIALYLVYRLLVSFQVANAQLLALLESDAEEVSIAETSAEVVSDVYRSIPGITLELDEDDRVLTLSRDAERCLDLKPGSTPHYSETRLIRVSDVEFAVNGVNSKKLKAALKVDVPWSSQPHQLEISSSYDSSLNKHKILTLTPIEDTNYRPGKFVSQELSEIASSNSDGTLHFVVMSIDIFNSKASYHPVVDAQKLALELDNEYPVILEVTRSDIAICTVISRDLATINEAIELIKERQDRALTQQVGAPIGYVIGMIDQEDPESLISRSQIALEIARETGGSPFVEYDENLYGDWDPSVRSHMIKALEDQEIRLEPIKGKKKRPDLLDIVAMRVHWHNQPNIVQPEHLSLYQWLSKYDLIGKLPSIEPSKAVEISNELLASNTATKVIFELPDELAADFEQLRYICGVVGEKPEFAGRTILAIREETAAKFSPEQWQELDKQHNRGVRFALSDIGTGDSDMSLLSNPIFEMLYINKELASRGIVSDKNRIILRNLLSLSKTLGKSTLVNAPASDTATLCGLGADYVVEVEN